MSSPPVHGDALTLYRNLQHEVRSAINRAADGLGEQRVACPATPDDPYTTLEAILRSMIRQRDYAKLGQRLLMVLGEAARQQDAVALFVVDTMAKFYATQQVQAMQDEDIAALGLGGIDAE